MAEAGVSPDRTLPDAGRSLKKWTVMVYMAAGDSNSLDMVAVRDLKEMERGLKDSPHVHVVVQINRHWPRGAQRYEVKASGSRIFKDEPQLPGDTDMGKKETLAAFLEVGLKFPAHHYCLVLWGHAFGLGFGRDHNDGLMLPELKDALLEFKTKREEIQSIKDGRLELLAANACSMSYVEAAHELREAVGLMAASQITTPFSGLPYDAILGRVEANTEPIQLARSIIDACVHQFDDLPAYDDALKFINRALDLKQRAAASPSSIARSLRIRGLLRQNKGDYALGRADLEQALSLQETVYSSHPETAVTLMHLGEQFEIEGALPQAHAVLSRACDMAEGTLRPGHPAIATCFGSLALVLEELGDLVAAKSFRERGLTIAETALGTDHPRFAVQLNDLANNYLLQGEFSTARTLYERAHKTYVKRLGAESNGAAVATYNLALLYFQLGDYREARRAFEQAIATWTRVLGPQHRNVGRGLSALAELLAAQGLHAEARLFYTRALKIREPALGADHPDVARTLSGLASSLAALGRSREALSLSDRSLQVWEQSGDQQSLADALVIHAQILSRTGNAVGAGLAYKRALDIYVPLLGPSHPTVGENEVALATVELRLGRTPESFERGLRGERIGREHSRLTLGYLAEREALDYAAKRPHGLDLALSIASSPQELSDAFNELILGRSLALDEIAARRRIIPESQSGDASRLWTELRSSRQRLANLIVRGPTSGNQQYAAIVDAARRDKEVAERTLADQSAAFRASQRQAEAGLAEIRRALQPGAALVSFVRYDRAVVNGAASDNASSGASIRTVPSYLALVLCATDPQPILVKLGTAAQIDSAISAWRQALMLAPSRPTAELVEAEQSLRVLGAQLRRRLWDPVSTHLDGITRVFVVPDSAINLVSFSALPASAGGYLLEHGPVIHYVSAERDLVAPAAAARPTGGLLAVGGPAFNDPGTFAALRNRQKSASAETSGTGNAALPSAAAFRGTSSLCASFQNMSFTALPAAVREVNDVAALWRRLGSSGPGSVAETLVGSQANETTFKRLAQGRRVIHLATHGFFLGNDCASPLDHTRSVGGLAPAAALRPADNTNLRPSGPPENPLVLSGLALAGANHRAAARPDEDDGILTAEEVASLDLTGVEWAVLSACNTGLGVIRPGEGVFGLRRAFQVAGVHTVIMSLWSVEDNTTRQWMQALYRGRLGRSLDTAVAMREAALAVLRDRRTQGLSGHPFFWAGFVAAGDWH